MGVSVASGGPVVVGEGTGEGAAIGLSVTPGSSGVVEGIAVGVGVGDSVGVGARSDGVAVGAEVGMGVGVMVMTSSLRSCKVGRGSQEPDGLLLGDGTPNETAGMGTEAAPAA